MIGRASTLTHVSKYPHAREQVVNIFVTNIFKDQVRLPISYIMPGLSWILAIGLGLIMPIVSNILPVRKALSSRLRDALDLYRSSAGEVTVTLQRLADLGLSPEITSLSITMVMNKIMRQYYHFKAVSKVTREESQFLQPDRKQVSTSS